MKRLSASERHALERLPPSWITGGVGLSADSCIAVRVAPGHASSARDLLRRAGVVRCLDIVETRGAVPRRRPNGAVAFPELAQPISFDRLYEELCWVCDMGGIGDFDVVLEPAVTAEHERNPRRYAQVTAHDDPPLFEFADQTLRLPWHNRLGLYAHEVGHVLDPDPQKTEPGADRAALERLGIEVGYDRRWPGKGLQVAVAGPGTDI